VTAGNVTNARCFKNCPAGTCNDTTTCGELQDACSNIFDLCCENGAFDPEGDGTGDIDPGSVCNPGKRRSSTISACAAA